MLLSLLSKVEKNLFVDLAIELVSVDGKPSETELAIIKKFKKEIGEDVSKYKKSNLSKEKLLEYFVQRSYPTKNLVYMNLVATSLNDDYYVLMQDAYELVGESSGNSYKLGQKVRVKVKNCDLAMRTIDFVIV